MYRPVKSSNQNLAELLQSLPILEERWANIIIDLITGLPTSREENYNTILIIVDRLTCQAYFWPTYTIVSTE